MIINIKDAKGKDRHYKVKTEWEDITLELAKKVNEIKKPKQLIAVYNAKDKDVFNEAVKKVKRDQCIPYYKDVILMLSNIPKDVIQSTEIGITDFFFKYIEKIVVDLHNMYPFSYKFRKIKSFKFKGKMYMMPAEDNFLDDSKPMANETTEAFINAMDLRSAVQNKIMQTEGLAGITGVFARPNGDPFDEKGAIERAKLFSDLTMDNHWEVFFCLMDLLKRSAEITNTFLEEQAKAQSN